MRRIPKASSFGSILITGMSIAIACAAIMRSNGSPCSPTRLGRIDSIGVERLADQASGSQSYVDVYRKKNVASLGNYLLEAFLQFVSLV